MIRILDRLARQGVPVRASDAPRPEHHLERARIRAEQLADDAGRGEMLDDAREAVIDAYTARLGNMNLWTSGVATGVPYSPRDRADSQAALLDLVTAAVTEDLLEASDVRLLGDDGQLILDLPTLAMRASSGDRVGMLPRVLRVIGAVALAGLVFLIAAGVTEDLVVALFGASVVVLLLWLSVFGPGWWERRGQTR